MNKIIRDLLGLSSGTLSRLFGTAVYTEIERCQAAWMDWAMAQTTTWETWQDCWADYRKTLPQS